MTTLPHNRWFTLLAVLAWVALAVYIVTNPSPQGVVILVVVGLFVVLPALVVTLITWLERRRPVDEPEDA